MQNIEEQPVRGGGINQSLNYHSQIFKKTSHSANCVGIVDHNGQNWTARKSNTASSAHRLSPARDSSRPELTQIRVKLVPRFVSDGTHIKHPPVRAQSGEVEPASEDDDVKHNRDHDEIWLVAVRTARTAVAAAVATRTERKHELVVTPMGDDAEEDGESERDGPEREVVRVEEDEFERGPRHGEVVVVDAQADGETMRGRFRALVVFDR